MDEDRKHIIETETLAWLKANEEDVIFSGRPPWNCVLHVAKVLDLPVKGELVGDAGEVMKYIYVTWKKFSEEEEKKLTQEQHLQRELALLKKTLGEENPDVAWVQRELAKDDLGLCEEHKEHGPYVHFRGLIRKIAQHYAMKRLGGSANVRKSIFNPAFMDQPLLEQWLKISDISREQLQRVGMEDDGIPYYKWRTFMLQIGRAVVAKQVTWKALGLEK